jgi:pimeloyl-ACP methyl ester carboxylesterase
MFEVVYAMSSAGVEAPTFITVHGVRMEIRTAGSGRPLIFLHPGIGFLNAEPFVALLGKHFRVTAPSHPGFERSELPDWMSCVDDLAYLYLDLFDELGINDAIVVGASFGGWIAAEIAVKSTARIGCLVLMDSLGIKIGDREQRDIADIYGLTRSELDRRSYSDLSVKPNFATMTDDQLMIVARNRESEALFGWAPYMHDPKLLGRLHRIRKSTLVIWGADDGIVSTDYGRAFAGTIPAAAFEVVSNAAHFPHIEQPDECARRIVDFANRTASQRAPARAS